MAAPRNDNVKEKILDAATGLLDTQTFADISLAEIAAAAGVSKGTLYYHYKNKTDILFGITNRYLDRQWDDLIAWTENKDKDTSVHRLVKYVVERNTASAGMRLHLIHAAMLGDEALRAYYRSLSRLRNESEALRRGTVRVLEAGRGRIAFLRETAEQKATVFVNCTDKSWQLPDGYARFGCTMCVDREKNTLLPGGFCVLFSQKSAE